MHLAIQTTCQLITLAFPEVINCLGILKFRLSERYSPVRRKVSCVGKIQ